jgi:hypothetical protein
MAAALQLAFAVLASRIEADAERGPDAIAALAAFSRLAHQRLEIAGSAGVDQHGPSDKQVDLWEWGARNPAAQLTKTRCACDASGRDDHHWLTRRDRFALGRNHLEHDSVDRRFDGDLHFHGLDDGHDLALADALPGLHE